ncbi:MAG: septum formation initiator family protein [Acidimicrobiia bacterium]|nr:septum formation initiator family protein [Acidimicrobiia bacterium]
MIIARRTLGSALLITTIVVVLLFGVLPTRDFLDQRAALSEQRSELEAIEAENAALEQRIDDLQTREEIELLARRDFNFVYPGQEAYAILPPPPPPVSLPSAWPFWRVADLLED